MNNHLSGLPLSQNYSQVESTQNVSHLSGQQNLYRYHGQPSHQPYAHTPERYNYAFSQPKANTLTKASPAFPELGLRRNCPALAVVIEKFDGDPMNYWLFVS